VGNITFFVIFAVLDVSLDVNLCINCSFLHVSMGNLRALISWNFSP